MMYTFDIFDTLLTRRFYNHLGIFAYMGHVLRCDCAGYGVTKDFARDFFKIRSYADTEAHKRLGREANFEEIYDFIRIYAGIGQDVAQKLMELEITAEIQFSEPIYPNIAIAEGYLNQGHTVVMLSDMYHSPKTLRRMIAKAVPSLKTCDILVSAHDGGSKGSGNLFHACMKRYRLSPKEICHYGDHVYADYKKPMSLGIATAPRFSKADRNYYATYLHRFAAENFHFDHYIGISRLCDLNNTLDEAAKIGCYIAGPLLYAFVEWTLKTALERSKKDVFFLARDGLPLLEIAKKIVARRGYPLHLHYLYISRLAAYRCSLFSGYTPEILDFAFLGGVGITPEDIAERLQLDPALLKTHFSQNGLHLETTTPLTAEKIQQVRRILETSKELADLSCSASAQERKALLAYLESANFSFSDATLVDVGWKGSIQDILYTIAEHENIPADITGLYFGVCEHTNRQNAANKKYGYLLEPHTLEARTWLHDGVFVFLEIFCHHCEHGTVTGYSFEQGIATAQYDDVYSGNVDFLAALHKGIHIFVDKILETAIENSDTSRFAGYYLRLLQEPDLTMAKTLGQYEHLAGIHDTTHQKLVPFISLKTFLQHALSGKKLEFRWPEGALAFKNGLGARAYFFCRRQKPRLHKAQRIALRMREVLKRLLSGR